jgi:hypothetical protein
MRALPSSTESMPSGTCVLVSSEPISTLTSALDARLLGPA